LPNVGSNFIRNIALSRRIFREALLRLLEKADAAGAREVHNIRFEFSRVGDTAKGGAELLAYGTAVL